MDLTLWICTTRLPIPQLSTICLLTIRLNRVHELYFDFHDGKKAIFHFFHINLQWAVDVLSEPTPKRKTSKTWTVLVVQLRHLSLLPSEIGHYGNLCPLSGRTTSCFGSFFFYDNAVKFAWPLCFTPLPIFAGPGPLAVSPKLIIKGVSTQQNSGKSRGSQKQPLLFVSSKDSTSAC